MRYTRNRQEAKARKTKLFNGGGTNIKVVDTNWNHPNIDKSFKWHREYNNVSFTHKYKFLGTWESTIHVDLYRQDSVYS